MRIGCRSGQNLDSIAMRRELLSGRWNRFLPWGKEKVNYRRDALIAVRRKEINFCREAKKKTISPLGVNCRQVERISTKTNTNSLHIQIRYIQFCVKLDTWNKLYYINLYIKRAPKKNLSWKKINPSLSPGTRKYVESVLRRKKMIPYKPYVHKKHVESILVLGTFLTHEKKLFNLNTTICDSVRVVDPYS